MRVSFSRQAGCRRAVRIQAQTFYKFNLRILSWGILGVFPKSLAIKIQRLKAKHCLILFKKT